MPGLYKVMLVDDEEDVRGAVIRKLDWASLGFTVAGEASNGEEALEMAERLEPDVIMTDIKMPFMDGLELCRRVKRQLPGIRMAILSGFDEFEYAREAITQQVEHYILKPIDADELASVFVRIRASLDAEIAERRDMEMLRRHYEESLPIIRQQILLEWIGGHAVAETLRRRAAEYGLELNADAYCAVVIRYEAEEEGARLLSISLQRLIEDTIGDTFRFYTVQASDHIAVLCQLERETALETLSETLQQLFPLSRKLLGIRLHIGIGKRYVRFEDMCRSYDEASSALEYQFLLDAGQCLYIGDIEPGMGSEQPPDPSYTEELLRQIKIGSERDLTQALQALVAHLRGINTGPQHYQIFLLELQTGLLRLIRTYRMDEKEAGLDALLAEGITMRLSDLGELFDRLQPFCENLRCLIRRERKDSVRVLIDKAKDIMELHYVDSDLSLESVCAQLGVSAAYFSTVFKRETGEGFVGYLTGLRMERALELLNTTDDKTYEIAGKIGYDDPNYFSYVFKKRFGVSPSKFRTAAAMAP